MSRRQIYVCLPDEAVGVWRPVEAEELGDGLFRIVSDNPDSDIEQWEFPPGSVVRCEHRTFEEGSGLVAVEAVEHAS